MILVSSRRPQSGQVSTEYLVGCLVALTLLLTEGGNGMSALSMITDAVRESFSRFVAALSIT